MASREFGTEDASCLEQRSATFIHFGGGRDHRRRDASDDGAWSNILGDDSAGCDNRVVTDGDTRHEQSVSAYVRSPSD